MKRTALMLALAALCLLAGCAREELPLEQLTECGLEVAAALQEECRSQAEKLAPAYDEIKSHLLRGAEGDYTKIKSIYRIRVDYEAVRKSTGLDSEDVMILWAVPTMINGRGGTMTLAAAQQIKASRSADLGQTVEPTLLVFTFEAGSPVAVIFSPGEDGAVHSQGVLILNQMADFADPATLEPVLSECFATLTQLK